MRANIVVLQAPTIQAKTSANPHWLQKLIWLCCYKLNNHSMWSFSSAISTHYNHRAHKIGEMHKAWHHIRSKSSHKTHTQHCYDLIFRVCQFHQNCNTPNKKTKTHVRCNPHVAMHLQQCVCNKGCRTQHAPSWAQHLHICNTYVFGRLSIKWGFGHCRLIIWRPQLACFI